MKILLVIIFFHLAVMYRAKQTENDGIPYLSVFFITILLVGFVMIIMFRWEFPET